jgi:type II secretory pathway component PulM
MNSTPATTPKKKISVSAFSRALDRWQMLEPRTRTVLLVSVVALLLGLAYAYVWLPATRGRALNAERIPVLEAKLATMRAEVAEMTRMLAVPPNTSTNSASARGTADMAGLQSIFGTTAKIAVDENRAFRINVASISYTSFLDRLDQALSRYRLKVDALNITALDSPISAPAKTTEPAMVAVEVTLSGDTSPTSKP